MQLSEPPLPMKSFMRLLYPIACLSLAVAQPSQARAASESALASVSTEWKGVHFEIAQIQRLDENHILVAVRIRGDATATNPTLISGRMLILEDGSEEITPFTLIGATLSDPETGQTYPAVEGVPAEPYWGEPSIVTSLRANTWIQLAVRFKAPPPRINADGRRAEQKISFQFPKAKKATNPVSLP